MFTKKWLLRLGLGFHGLIVLGMAAVYAEWTITRNRGQEMLDKEIAKVDAEDPDWRAADLCAKRNAALPPKDRNSADRAMEAYALVPETYKRWPMNECKSANETVGVLPDADDRRIIAAMHADASEAIVRARTLRNMPNGGSPMIYAEPEPIGTLMESTQNLRMVASILDTDAVILASDGDGNSALRTTHAILNTARAVGDEPFMISTLVRIALTTIACRSAKRTLGWSEPTAGLAELQSAFAEELGVPRLTYGLRGERAMQYLLMENIDSGALDPNSVESKSATGIKGRLGTAPMRRTLPNQQAYLLDIYGQMLAAEKLEGKERIAAFAAVKPAQGTGFVSLLMSLLLPSTLKVGDAESRCRAILGTTIIALACERFRLANGRFPNSIAEIPKTLLPKVPDDPFTGDPLVFKTLADGIVIYSVGADLVDDGGTNLDLTAKVGGDVGFKLLLPEKRRQPAPVKPKVENDKAELPGSGTEP